MIAVDTSTWIAFLHGDDGEDVDLLPDRALQDRQVLMAPVVLYGDVERPEAFARGFGDSRGAAALGSERRLWQRAGALRAKALAKRRKARLGDALIAQSCIDRGIPLLTRDRDFRAFADAAGLESSSWGPPPTRIM